MQCVQVLAGLISSIVGSQSTHSRAVAKHAGLGAKVDSREQRLSRWYQNEQVSYELDYLPYLQEMLAGLAGLALPLAIDGREIGRGCMVLMVSLLYNQRAIRLAWTVFQRPKGHASAEEHIQLLEVVRPCYPQPPQSLFSVMANLIVLCYRRIYKPCHSGSMFVTRRRIRKLCSMVNG